MAWTIPKTDWVFSDSPTHLAFNRIGNNLTYLKDLYSEGSFFIELFGFVGDLSIEIFYKLWTLDTYYPKFIELYFPTVQRESDHQELVFTGIPLNLRPLYTTTVFCTVFDIGLANQGVCNLTPFEFYFGIFKAGSESIPANNFTDTGNKGWYAFTVRYAIQEPVIGNRFAYHISMEDSTADVDVFDDTTDIASY